MKKHILSILVVVSLLASYVYATSTTELLKQKGVKIYTHTRVQTEQPAWIQMSNTWIQHMNTWATYWINRIPYEQDRKLTTYIVIPRLWVVAPLVELPKNSPDFQKTLQWLSIDLNSYLQNWVLHYPSVAPWNTGNVVVAWHSSYWKDDIWRYKNIFMTLPLLEFGDQIWTYTQISTWVYERHIYTVWESYETDPFDTSVLKKNPTEKIITLFTCTPIGTAKKRRIIKAKIREYTKKIIKKRAS
jgi:LPXTG-site transpeptidase (sortase) family protein